MERWARDLASLGDKCPNAGKRDRPNCKLLFVASGVAGSRTKLRFARGSQDFVPPQTEMERAIAGVWQGLFGLDRVSIEENFFDLGRPFVAAGADARSLRETFHGISGR